MSIQQFTNPSRSGSGAFPSSSTNLLSSLVLASLLSCASAQIFLDADTPETGADLETTPLVTSFGVITFVGEVRVAADADATAVGSAGQVFDGIGNSPAEAQLDFGFDVFSISFLYGGNGGGILVEALDQGGNVLASFDQVSTGNGEPAGPVTLAADGIRSLRWSDTSGGFVMLDNVVVRPMPVLFLDMETPASGSELANTPLVTPIGRITMSEGEASMSSDGDVTAAGGGGGSLDVAGGLQMGRLDFTFEAESITLLYGGNFGGIDIQALDAMGGVVDTFSQADTGNGQPAGPVTLSGGGIRFLQWSDPMGSFAIVDNLEITVTPSIFLDMDTPATGSQLETEGLMSLYGAVTLRGGEVSSVSDAEAIAEGAGGDALDVDNGTQDARLDLGFEAAAVTFVYGGNNGSIEIEALDVYGNVVDSFFQASTAGGQPAGPHTLVGAVGGIRTLVWRDAGGGYAILDDLQIAVTHNVILDADTPLTGSELDTSVLVTPYGDVTMAQGEFIPSADPDMQAEGAEGDAFDGAGSFPAIARLDFSFDVDAVTFLYGGGIGEINIAAFDEGGSQVDSFFQADTGNGQPAGPMTLLGGGIRTIIMSDPSGSSVMIDNVTLDVAPPETGCAGNCGNCDLQGANPNILDSLVAAQLAAGLVQPLPGQDCACDVDSSGAINVLDALRIAQAAAGLPAVLMCN